jgi:pyridoxine kinase
MKTTAPQILELFEGLQQSGIDNFQYLLTGYLPNAETVAAIGTIAKKLKAKDPGTIWGTFFPLH